MSRPLQHVLVSLQQAKAALCEARVFFADVAASASSESLKYRMAQAGYIKHFEFTFELARNVIQRWLREQASRPEAVELPITRREIFRCAARAGIIDHPERWFDYADARNATSHTYKREVAHEICDTIETFIDDVVTLLQRCQVDDD